MVRTLNVLFVLAVVIGAATVYDMKLAAKKSASRVSQLQAEIETERNAIRHLRARWSELNQPDRLQDLVERYNGYLELEPMDVKQIVAPQDLPARPVLLEPIRSPDPMGGYAGTSTVVQ